MKIGSIPTEIWLDIGTSLDRSDHHSLVLVCRKFNNIFTEALYSSLALTIYKTTYSSRQGQFVTAADDALLVLKRLETSATLKNAVRQVHIRYLQKWDRESQSLVDGNHPEEPSHDALVGIVIGILERLPLLQEVEFTYVIMRTKWLLHLASHSNQNLRLQLNHSQLYGNAEPIRAPFETEPPLSAVVSRESVIAHALSLRNTKWQDCSIGLYHFLTRPSFETLEIGVPTPPTVLNAALYTMGHCSRMRSLTLPYITSLAVSQLGALVNLKELRFLATDALGNYVIPGDIPPSILRKLDVLKLPNNALITALTSGRMVTSISTAGYISYMAAPPIFENPRFNSEVVVRTMEWNRCYEWDELLDYLIQKNRGVWHLDIEPVNGPNFDTETLPCLAKFAQLPELRTLKFTTLTHVPSERTLAWERRQCEYLRSVGSPFLVSISFSELITWTRHPDDESLWRPSGTGMETVKLNLQFSGR